MNRWELTDDIRNQWKPIIKGFLDNIDSLTAEEVEKYEDKYFELNLNDTNLNPHALWEILKEFGYEDDEIDENGWEQDFWIDLIKKNTEKDVLTNIVKIEAQGMTFSLSLKVFIN